VILKKLFGRPLISDWQPKFPKITPCAHTWRHARECRQHFDSGQSSTIFVVHFSKSQKVGRRHFNHFGDIDEIKTKKTFKKYFEPYLWFIFFRDILIKKWRQTNQNWRHSNQNRRHFNQKMETN